MCHMVPRPVYFIWHYVIWYHDQCISHRNVSYGTTTSVFHLALCHMVPRPVYFTWKCVIRYHDQCNLAICLIRYHNQCISPGNVFAVPRKVQPSNVSCGTTTSVFHLVICYTVPQPVSFTWQCVMRYHDQCNLAVCHMVPQPVYFTWQYAIRYHNQCLSPGNVSCGTTTSAT